MKLRQFINLPSSEQRNMNKRIERRRIDFGWKQYPPLFAWYYIKNVMLKVLVLETWIKRILGFQNRRNLCEIESHLTTNPWPFFFKEGIEQVKKISFSEPKIGKRHRKNWLEWKRNSYKRNWFKTVVPNSSFLIFRWFSLTLRWHVLVWVESNK